MNVKVCKATLQKRISHYAPKFHEFMLARKLYNGLIDAIIINSVDGDEPYIITSHSDVSPYEYYEWIKRGETYCPRPAGPVNLNNLITPVYIDK